MKRSELNQMQVVDEASSVAFAMEGAMEYMTASTLLV